MKIYVIRHGQTLWNAQGRLQGAADIPLNDNGTRLARITGQALKEVTIFCCFTSPLKRARDTASLILEGRDVPIFQEERIREISFGEWEGQDMASLPQDMLDNFFHHPQNFKAPAGGESFTHLQNRTKMFFHELASREDFQDKTILVSTHGCAMRAFLQNVYKDPSLENFWHGKVPPNCGVNIIEINQGKALLLKEDVVFYQ
ncbi:MAG: histidine phosphatase family protein [Blautia sp.]